MNRRPFFIVLLSCIAYRLVGGLAQSKQGAMCRKDHIDSIDVLFASHAYECPAPGGAGRSRLKAAPFSVLLSDNATHARRQLMDALLHAFSDEPDASSDDNDEDRTTVILASLETEEDEWDEVSLAAFLSAASEE